jgi:adenosine deaminase
VSLASRGHPAAPFPLAELHCHVEGTLSPGFARELAAREGLDIAGFADAATYRWQGFSGFLAAYDRAAALLRDEDDYRRLAFDYLTGLAAQGALYSELTISPDHATASGLSPRTYLGALARGAAEAERETGIVCRFLVVGVRHLGPEAVEAAARFAAQAPGVTGFGLAGDERLHRPRDFARAFRIAAEAGLGLTAHAGEFAGPEAVAETLDALGVSRLGHGVRAVEDAELLARLRAERITLEICPGSNIALGLYADAQAHPLARLREAGLRLTVNSDDPPFFGTDLTAEYAFAGQAGFGPAERLALTRNAIEAAFVEAPVRRRLLELLTMRALALGAPGSSL